MKPSGHRKFYIKYSPQNVINYLELKIKIRVDWKIKLNRKMEDRIKKKEVAKTNEKIWTEWRHKLTC